jgi:hypothetical protein
LGTTPFALGFMYLGMVDEHFVQACHPVFYHGGR